MADVTFKVGQEVWYVSINWGDEVRLDVRRGLVISSGTEYICLLWCNQAMIQFVPPALVHPTEKEAREMALVHRDRLLENGEVVRPVE